MHIQMHRRLQQSFSTTSNPSQNLSKLATKLLMNIHPDLFTNSMVQDAYQVNLSATQTLNSLVDSLTNAKSKSKSKSNPKSKISFKFYTWSTTSSTASVNKMKLFNESIRFPQALLDKPPSTIIAHAHKEIGRILTAIDPELYPPPLSQPPISSDEEDASKFFDSGSGATLTRSRRKTKKELREESLRYARAMKDMERTIATLGGSAESKFRSEEAFKKNVVAKILGTVQIKNAGKADLDLDLDLDLDVLNLVAMRRLSLLLTDNFQLLKIDDATDNYGVYDNLSIRLSLTEEEEEEGGGVDDDKANYFLRVKQKQGQEEGERSTELHAPRDFEEEMLLDLFRAI